MIILKEKYRDISKELNCSFTTIKKYKDLIENEHLEKERIQILVILNILESNTKTGYYTDMIKEINELLEKINNKFKTTFNK